MVIPEQKGNLLNDRELLGTIKDLMVIQKFTNNKEIIEGLDLIIWQLIIDQLKKSD